MTPIRSLDDPAPGRTFDLGGFAPTQAEVRDSAQARHVVRRESDNVVVLEVVAPHVLRR